MLAAPLRGRLALAACLAAAALLPCGAARAADYPARDVRIIVPFPAGGTADIAARVVAAELGKAWGKAVVVDNKAGAGGNVGTAEAARASADGYTLLMGTVSTHAINQSVYAKLPYDPVKDFTPVTLVIPVPNVLELNPGFADKHGIRNVADLIKYLKANPGSVNMASTGNGTSTHLSGELFQAMTGTRMTHVPYKGAGEAIPALLSGQVSMYFDTIMTGLPQVKSGALLALGMSNSQRSALAPDIPTIAEQGYAGYDIAPWYGLVAPEGTPAPILDKLNRAVNKVLADPALRGKLAEAGAEPRGGSRDEFAAFIKAEIPRTKQLIDQAGITPQ